MQHTFRPSSSPPAPELPKTLHEAAAGVRFTQIDLAPLPSAATVSTLAEPSTTPEIDVSRLEAGSIDSNEVASDTTSQIQEGSLEPTSQTATQPAGTTLAGVAVAAGAGLLLWALWQWGRRSRGSATGLLGASRREAGMVSRAQPATPTSHGALSSPSPAHQQLIAAADRVARQLEQRAGQLERFIEQADSRIIELKRLSIPMPSKSAAEQRTPGNLQSTTVERQHASFPRASAVPTQARAANAQAADHPVHASSSAGAGITNSHPHAEVHALADAGLSPVQIAQRLAKPTGQIELILNLRKAAMVA